MMYLKLAFDNIRKNSRTYLPYIFTCIFTIAMFYIMKSLSMNSGLKNAFGGDTTQYLLELGSYIIAIFAFIFLFYTNSFLTKNRKKEFGLYNILGMEKRHIAKMIGFEGVFTLLISLVGGLGLGILFDKLMYVAISRLIKVEFSLGFYISTNAIKITIILFSILFLLIFLNSLRMIHLSKPIELLKGGNIGEKEPKAKLLIALLGLACLGTGYYMSLTIKNPIMALTLFFVAVILVIIGTYLLFTAGSITYLKILKKNKRYYYKTKHFISVSGMLYRMKQNAVGLANICILSTMVLIMVSTTVSLMAGVDGIVKERYPYQIEFSQITYNKSVDLDITKEVKELAAKNDIEISGEVSYTSLQFSAVYEYGDEFTVDSNNSIKLINNVHNLNFITAGDYSRYIGKNVSLKENEVILYTNKTPYKNDKFKLFGKEYTIIQHTDKYISNGLMPAETVPTFGIVVSDSSIIEKLYQEQEKVYGKNASQIGWTYGIDIDGNEDRQTEFANILKNDLKVKDGYTIKSRAEQRTELYSLFGGLFFIGIFLGTLFIIATVLIIYYKQISEGYEDKKRFEIMQKVGMSEHEVKSSIHSQVLTVFFMPLIIAGIHTSVAFPIVRKLLLTLNLTNVKLFAVCTICTFIAFVVIYILIYLLTAKIYYRIVSRASV